MLYFTFESLGIEPTNSVISGFHDRHGSRGGMLLGFLVLGERLTGPPALLGLVSYRARYSSPGAARRGVRPIGLLVLTGAVLRAHVSACLAGNMRIHTRRLSART